MSRLVDQLLPMANDSKSAVLQDHDRRKSMPEISKSKILIIATDAFEVSELLKPQETLKRRGANVTLAWLSREEIEGDNGAKVTPDVGLLISGS